MQIQFEFLYALLLLLVIPGLYFLYSKYNNEKKESILKFSSLKIIKKSVMGKNFFRKHLPFILMMGILGLINHRISKSTDSNFVSWKKESI